MSGTGVRNCFAELRLPRYAPGLGVWMLIGGAYYVLFFLLLKSILARAPVRFWTSITLVLTAAMLLANAVWNWIFFRKKNLWVSFAFFVPYILLSLMLGGVLFRIRNPLSGWYALYPTYLLYASWWGYRVWRLNSHSPENT